jgi:hypothetical protein
VFAALLIGATGQVLAGSDQPAADIEMFTREGCPFCAAALVFLEDLRRERPTLRIVVRDVQADPGALERLVALAEARGVPHLGVPAFHVAGELVIGFGGPETTGRQLRALLDRPRSGTAPRAGADDRDVETVEVPVLGRVSVRDVGLPAFTVVVGLLDGFNPCAMWVLLFVLSLLVNLRDRLRMLVLGGTFVLVSGLVYYAFMAAWLNLFLLVGVARPIEIVLGLAAATAGGLSVKDAFAPGRGLSLVIPATAKPGIYARVRAILAAGRLGPALAGVIALAILVNVVELLCTAGLPAVYTRILTLRELPLWQYYGYLALYNLAYVTDDGVMLAVAVVTLGRRKLQEGGGRWLKFVSGGVLLALGLTLIVRPQWLAGGAMIAGRP